ncbi:MAG: hypothetical protein ACRD3T_20480, partial [Terriglobia bacterium]
MSNPLRRHWMAVGVVLFVLLSSGPGFRANPGPEAPGHRYLPATLRLPDRASATRFVSSTARHPKLTTLLAEMAESTPQTPAPAVPGLLRPPVPGVSQSRTPAELPKAVADALRSRLMRMDSTGAVQVYVELTAVNSQALQQLQAAGVTLEITDAKHRRVQARVPPGSLTQVESLPFV